MKTKFLNTIGILALTAATFGTASAQTTPSTFSYQAVVTAEDGSPVGDHDLAVEVTIYQGNGCEADPSSCTTLWQELHSPKTNAFGGFSIEIGDPAAINTTGGTLDNISKIDWLNTTSGSYYMRVRVDFGEASYLNGMTDLGTTKFSSVPYALAAESANSAKTADAVKPVNGKIGNKLAELADVSIDNNEPNQILLFDGTTWKTVPNTAQGLTNITIKDPATGDHLVYNKATGNWENKPVQALSLAGLSDVKTTTNITQNDVLSYNATSKQWENKNLNLDAINGVSIPTTPTPGQVLTFADNVWKAKDAPGSVSAIAQLTDDVKITNPADGQILKYNLESKKWVNEAAPATDIWLTTEEKKTYRNPKYGKVGIGTNNPLTLLHIGEGGDNSANVLIEPKSITIAGTNNRCGEGTGQIALCNGDENSVNGTAVIAGRGSKTGSSGYENLVINTIVLGNESSSNGEHNIVIGKNCSTGIKGHCALLGEGLEAGNDNQFICGYYNTYVSDAILIVGNGRSNNRSNVFTINESGEAYLNGSLISSSDARLKTNVQQLSTPLARLTKLRGVTFNWDKTVNPKASDKTQYGFIAQEVEQVLPDLVSTDSNGYKTVNYIGVIPVLTEAVKEQQDQINQLKSENEQLKSTLEQLLRRVEALENR